MRYQSDFLHLFYPELTGKKYWATFETATFYDGSERAERMFLVDIGDGAKYEELGCCFVGYAGNAQPPRPRPPNVDEHGAFHPNQYLSAVFVFDSQGSLKSFTARGSAAEAPDSVNKFWEKLLNHPEVTDEELIAAYKESGAKYALGDRETFKRDLPINKLEQFLGKLEIAQTEFLSFTTDDMNRLGAFSHCFVHMLTSGGRGKPLQYEADFEATRGALVGLRVVPDKDKAALPKSTN